MFFSVLAERPRERRRRVGKYLELLQEREVDSCSYFFLICKVFIFVLALRFLVNVEVLIPNSGRLPIVRVSKWVL